MPTAQKKKRIGCLSSDVGLLLGAYGTKKEKNWVPMAQRRKELGAYGTKKKKITVGQRPTLIKIKTFYGRTQQH